MNIWYISKYAVTPNHGQPTRQFFLSKYLSRLGNKVTLISSISSGVKQNPISGNFLKEEVDGVESVILNGPIINYGMSPKRIYSWIIFELRLFFLDKKKLSNKKPDVIIVSSLSLLTILNGVYFKNKYKAKLIFEIRDIWPLTLIEVGGFSRRNLFIKTLSQVEKFGYANADGIVGTMPKLDEHIKTIINKPFNFKCIPMGYDPEYFKFGEIEEERAIKFPTDKFIVGYAGAIGTANLVDETVEAARILSLSHPNIYFAILGDGPLKDKLINESKGLQNICFFPKIDKKHVPNFLAKCDLLINSWKDETLYKFGVSPNKWIDYMLSGKPVLVAFGGFQSIINEANCGVFIKPNDPTLLAQTIAEFSTKDKAELREIGERGRKFVMEGHTFEALAKDYIVFIKSLQNR